MKMMNLRDTGELGMRVKNNALYAAIMLALVGTPAISAAATFIQCPGDVNGDAIIDIVDPARKVKCLHFTGGDGFTTMADGKTLYTFGFGNVTGMPAADVMTKGILRAEFPGPSIVMDEGDELYLTLSNTGLINRPDLFDPHTVHYHGFPNASSYFDGVPENTTSINMGGSFTYYYNQKRPGTYMYHCHVEATEHMQMGMLANLYVNPRQNGTAFSYTNEFGIAKNYTQFVYNDGDGSTGYDVGFPIQLAGFDPVFHDASINVQPLPFAKMYDTYPLMNGRGYPDTVNTAPLAPPMEDGKPLNGNVFDPANPGVNSQVMSSLITATKGERILVRLSSLSVSEVYTMSVQGLPLQVVGKGAGQLKGPNGDKLYYNTSTITLAGGEAKDVMIDTSDPNVKPGTYYLYTTNLKYLSNNTEDFGGLMTEIVIN